MHLLMFLAAALIALIEALPTFVPYKKGKYRRWRWKRRVPPATPPAPEPAADEEPARD